MICLIDRNKEFEVGIPDTMKGSGPCNILVLVSRKKVHLQACHLYLKNTTFMINH